MSGVHYRNGGCITSSAKPFLTRDRGTVTTNYSYNPTPNDAKTAIIDRSPSALTVSATGAERGSDSPFTGTNKGNIALVTNYTTLAVSATSNVFTFGTGDFTIMTWYYLNVLGSYGGLFEGASAGGSRINTFVWTLYNNGSGGAVGGVFHNGNWQFQATSTIIPTYTWVHLALIRSNGVTKYYVNGSLKAQTSTVMNVTTNYGMFGKIGDATGSSARFANYNVTKGVALYTGDFTPPSLNEPVGSVSASSTANTTTYGVYKLGY